MPTPGRPMNSSEKYFTFLDLAWPCNIMIVGELDIVLPVDQVEAVWRQFCERRSFARLSPREDLSIVDLGRSEVEFAAIESTSDGWHAIMDRESTTAYGLPVPLRCRYLVSPTEDRSRVVLVGHHAVVDGRAGVANLQAFVRGLDGQPIPEQNGLSVLSEPARTFPWRDDRRELISTLRGVAREQNAVGDAGPRSWQTTTEDRAPVSRPLIIDAPATSRLVPGMRHAGVRPLPTISAGWLDAVSRTLDPQHRDALTLGTAVDLNGPAVTGSAPTASSVGVVANRFSLANRSVVELALDVSAALTRSTERGDGELFLQLTRVSNIDQLDVGTARVREQLASAVPSVNVTNLGVVDPGTDPTWLRWMCGYLAPTPNQMIFVSGLGYRGQMVNSVTTDRNRVTVDQIDTMTATFEASMEDLAGATT